MISLIFAMDKNNLIGKDNSLPWHYSEDLKYFRNTTRGHKVLMGDNTYLSIGKALPNRTNYVATLNKEFKVSDAIIINDLISFLKENEKKEEEIFIIGGKQIYALSLPYANRLYITHIDSVHEGNIYFPEIDYTKYNLIINGDYKFIITDIYNNTKEINIKIEDIKRTYTCSGTVDRKGTNLEIKGIPNINTAIAWKINNKPYIGNTNKVNLKYKKANTAEVTITYSNNYSDKVTCNIKNNLTYQFNIESRSTPLTCGKVNTGLNSTLEKVVNEAGKGTRSGVVEAARFLQSAVPYVIPYQGKSANNLYKFHGLSSEWGCRASNGYINGLDCVGLFWWPFYQNDNRGDGQGACSNNAVPLKDNLDKIRVGDWIVSYDADIKKSMGCAYSHGSIIIGIDDKYIYTLSNNVEIFNKKNLPGHNQTNGDVYLAHYGNDGDYTDMWVTDY